MSGAKVNLSKSILIQLDSGPPLAWFQLAGCLIAQPGKIVTYLGCPIGNGLHPEQEVEFVLAKLRKKLRNWTHKFLLLTSKVLILKHIL